MARRPSERVHRRDAPVPELVVRKENLDQQRIIAHLIAMRTEQRIRIGCGELAQRPALLVAGFDKALRAGQPGFSDGFGGTVVVPGRQV